MYLNFYQLTRKPFSLAPDPDFLYLSQQHKDALGAIIYGIKARQGFVSVVGEVGTGKTTVVRSYLQKIGRDKVLPIFIFNSQITFDELMKTFLTEIGIDTSIVNKMNGINDMVRLAYRAMLEKTRNGKTIVLIIDEAQNMPVETLGRLCILSNFETAKTKLIQIVLVGQPELRKKLGLKELRQLRQRIAYRAFITPLSASESVKYINHRLSLSTKVTSKIFTKGAVRKIVSYSKGIPRIINILCENSLVAGYGMQKKNISASIVKQVVAEYEGKTSHQYNPIKVAGNLFAILLLVLLLTYSLPQLLSDKGLVESIASSKQVPVPESPVQMKNETTESEVKSATKVTVDDFSTLDQNLPAASVAVDHIENKSQSANLNQINNQQDANRSPEVSVETLPICLDKDSTHLLDHKVFTPHQHADFRFQQAAHLKVARKGDTVSSLCQSTYGFVNTEILRLIKSYNPHIYSLDEIKVDEIIFFPAIGNENVLQLAERELAAQETGVRRIYTND